KRRALGQHFLRDQTIARAIVELVAPTERDLVVEIGPGDGALTGLLAGRAGRVIALEIDRALAATIQARLPGVEVLEADARSWGLGRLRATGGRARADPGQSALQGRQADLDGVDRGASRDPRDGVDAPARGRRAHRRAPGRQDLWKPVHLHPAPLRRAPGAPRAAGRLPPAPQGRFGRGAPGRLARAARSRGRPAPLRERRAGGVLAAAEDAGDRRRGGARLAPRRRPPRGHERRRRPDATGRDALARRVRGTGDRPALTGSPPAFSGRSPSLESARAECYQSLCEP